MSLPCHSPDRIDQFLNLVALIDRIARRKCVHNAVRYVVSQDLSFNLMQRRAHRIDLGQYVDAGALLADHPEQPADLALDPPEARGH